MRAFTPKPEPERSIPGTGRRVPRTITFDQRVRQRGNKWLAKNARAKPSRFPDYWNEFRAEVQAAFSGCCAYQGFAVNSGQIDHFVAKSINRDLTYEWSNYRWAEPRVNQLKGDQPFLDPFQAQPGWIEIDPYTMEFRLGIRLPTELHATGESMCRVLNHPELVRGRTGMFEWLLNDDGTWQIDNARRVFPLLADCIEAERAAR